MDAYLAALTYTAINRRCADTALRMPVPATSCAPVFMGIVGGEQMHEVAEYVEHDEVFQGNGHSLAREGDERLTEH